MLIMTHVSITILVGVQEERMRAGKMISELNRSLEVSRRGGEDLFDQVIILQAFIKQKSKKCSKHYLVHSVASWVRNTCPPQGNWHRNRVNGYVRVAEGTTGKPSGRRRRRRRLMTMCECAARLPAGPSQPTSPPPPADC